VEALEHRVTPTQLPSGFVESVVAGTLSNPTSMTLAPDGRFFVTEQGGDLEIIKNGQKLGSPFVHVSVNSSGERGLLGVALDPDFATNQFVYVYYTTSAAPIHNRVSRFTANGDTAVPGSEQILFELNNLSSATNHNGGALHFGADGKLYVAVGDNANASNAQTLTNLLGKMLRLNKDGTIPTDNPFFNQATGQNRAIWTLGLRNPFTFAFQPGSGRMFINDVGQSAWEEINDGIAGSNYGWPDTEGETSDQRYRSPLFAYGHNGDPNTTGCAITGGAFYDPATPQFPADYVGDYFFADFCGDWIRRYDPATDTAVAFASDDAGGVVDLDVGPDGRLYYLARNTGQVLQITFPAGQAPAITQHPADVTVSQGQPATFTVSATGAAPLTYQWQRNQVNINGANASTYTITNTTLADNGAKFRCVVSNSFGNATSNEATLTVLANQPPTGTITAPPTGTLYSAGETISYAGTGSDPEEGDLPASAFTWWVDFHHDDHFHPFMGEQSGMKTGEFTIPTEGETAANVWYRIHLRVTDSAGLRHESFRDVTPRVVSITLAANPSGLQLRLDGQPVTTPFTFTGVVGMTRTLEAVSPQSPSWKFASWSDGGGRVHNISTPGTSTTFLAMFRQKGQLANGLWARYWDNLGFSGASLNRLDPTLDYGWGSGSPAPSLGADTFTSRWVGFVRPQFSESYTLSTRSSDGVRVWLDGQLIIDNWTDHDGANDSSNPLLLTAGQDHVLVVEHYENLGNARARLFWESPSTPLAVIPHDRLFGIPNAVKTPWQPSDIGAQQVGGFSNHFKGKFILNGSGAGIGGTADAFHGVMQQLTGNGEIIARLISQQQTSAQVQAGIVIRDSLNADASNVFLGLTPGGLVFSHRASTGSDTNTQSGPITSPPIWLRLVRSGGTIDAFTSSDGVTWTPFGSATITLGATVQVGLAASSRDQTRLSTAMFDNVSSSTVGGASAFRWSDVTGLDGEKRVRVKKRD
jgi:glucose/arabinose dehydrogenase